MDLAKAVGLATVVIMLLIASGYVFAHATPPTGGCVIKPVMTDAEIDLCRRAAYGK